MAPSITVTVLVTSPASLAVQGSTVKLTATVTPPTAQGTVQFKTGIADFGNPVPVSNGTASRTVTLFAGSHPLTAVFIPTDPATFSPSTSSPVPLTVTAPGLVTPTIALATSPTSPVVQGSVVKLTATVTPATAQGTVQFKRGTTNLDNPVPVSNGKATLSVTLSAGSQPLTAVFTPAFNPSISPPVTFTVIPPAAATTTTLTASPASPIQGSPVKLTATVTPATAVGTVQFKRGTTNLLNPVPVSNGTASLSTTTLPTGSHQLTAVFTPTNPAAFSPSTSPPVPLTVT